MDKFSLAIPTRLAINKAGNYRNKSVVSNRSLDVRQDNELVRTVDGTKYDIKKVSGSSLGFFFPDFYLFALYS